MHGEASNGLYENFQQEIAEDSASDVVAYEAYRLLFPRLELETEDNPAQPKSALALYKALTNGIPYENFVYELRKLIRIRTIKHLYRAFKEITNKLEYLETKYFKQLAKYSHHPVITYNALTEIGLRRMRSELLTNFIPLQGSDRSSVMTHTDWGNKVKNYVEGLEELKKIAVRMSRDMVEWQKAIGDVWRLRAAITSVVLAGASLLGIKMFEVWKDYHHLPMEFVSTCTKSGIEGQYDCTFQQK